MKIRVNWSCQNSSEVIVQLTKSKCFVAMYYALEACSLRVSQFKSINYVISSRPTFRKIFVTKSKEVVDDCLEMFNCPPAEKTIVVRKCKFLTKFKLSSNILCSALVDKAELELSSCRPMSVVNV